MILNNIYFESQLFDFLLECGLETSRLEFLHLLKDLDFADVLEAFLPVGSVEFTCGKDDVVSAVLWQELDTLLIILINQFSEVLANHALLDVESVLADIWNFQEHRGRHIDGVEGLQVNVQMGWHLSVPLFSFLFKSLLGLSLTVSSLCQALTVSWSLADLHENGVGFIESAKSEESKSNLHDSSIVMDLVGTLLLMDQLLELTSEQQVLGFFDTVVDCVVESLQEDGSDSLSLRAVLRYLINKFLNYFSRWVI